MQIKISQIKIGDRHRKIYGDVEGLAASIKELGQLQPIGIDSNYRLIFGERRIKACLINGSDVIEGEIIHIENLLKGEYAENEFNEGWKVSERVAILDAIETLGRGARTDKEPHRKCGEVSADEAASKAGFGSADTAARATKAVENGIPELVDKMDAGEVSVSAASDVADMDPEEQQEVIAEIDAGVKPREAINAHVSNNSGNNEWYTPLIYIEAADAVMGGIDLDPASSDVANAVVGANTYYTKENSGLLHEWKGRVWMNPPYAQPLIKQFSDKLCLSVDDQTISEAVILVNNATETGWFQNMARRASAICFPSSRIKFMDPNGEPRGSPLQGQAILYVGANTDFFADIFSSHGFVAFLNE